VLDVENILDGAYFLEVSSPGIDRPLTRLKDFENYKGFEAKVETDTLVDNQKKYKGILKGVSGDNVLLETEKGSVTIPFPSIQRAKLMLTDELIKSAQQKKAN
jgi:ribosome maturation factor RimP